VPDEGALLRGKAGTQVLLHVKDPKGEAAAAAGRKDAQLEAAMKELQGEIKADPRPVPPLRAS
jgi:hypothetical protein